MNLFNKIKIQRPRRNVFDLSHERKASYKMGLLYPILCSEIVPGDKFQVSSEILIRLAPMLAPVMHRINVYTHYFFVPNRLIWEDWEDFITGGPDGTIAPEAPYSWSAYDGPYCKKGTLYDHLGLPPHPDISTAQSAKFGVLPFRAYQAIWNEYYRDQNLEDKYEFSKASGSNDPSENAALFELRRRAWEKDYFTSALPWAQRGAPVTIPGEVVYKDQGIAINTAGLPITGELSDKIILDNAGGINRSNDGTNVAQQMNIDNIENFNLTVNDLRTSVKLQEWLEKNARGGARYIEQILSHFGVTSSDSRLQRPEYLGGGVNPVVISEVLSTVGTVAEGIEAPQGNMAGHGISVGRTNQFKKSFEEHGFVIGIMSVLPKTAYQQGIHRMWLREDKTDYYWPEFAHLGEQEVRNHEIFYDFDATAYEDNLTAFGYQSRYADYKFIPSTVHGDFRDTHSFWHMGRIFDSVPQLNADFVKADPTKRIFAVEDPDVDDLYCQIYNQVKAVRPMPYFGTPRL